MTSSAACGRTFIEEKRLHFSKQNRGKTSIRDTSRNRGMLEVGWIILGWPMFLLYQCPNPSVDDSIPPTVSEFLKKTILR